MLSAEEKEAIEQLRSWKEYIIKHKEDVNKANDIEFYLRTAINLIEKQSKEIEYQKLKRENQRLELEANIEEYVKALTEWVNGERVSIHCVHKDKIKAKIEEIDKILERNLLVDSLRDYFDAQKEVLHSLLEKE